MKRSTLVAALVILAVAGLCHAGWKADVGYTSLQARLGAGLPTGSGIPVAHVEAPSSGNYLPDTSNTEFAGKTITAMSGASGVSNHATTVGLYFYGLSSSIAPGVTSIFSYNANHWIDSGLLRTCTSLSPAMEYNRVQNHSWIGTTGDEAADADILRRIDLVVERDGVVVVAGVNNGAGSTMPRLLGSAYNVLTVGLTNGNSSYGPTVLDDPGRVKPDIVAPSSLTSFGAPMVASAAALLAQAVDNEGVLSDLAAQQRKTAKGLLVRALLMAGATKAEFTDWRRGFATPCTDGTVPLDYRHGAGELNIDNSHRLLTAGEQEGGTTADVGLSGWDYGSATSGASSQYFFEIAPFSYASSLSVLVAWNRHIVAGSGNPLVLTPSLANIDLRLLEAEGFTPGTVRDQSISAIDNVEHIFLRGVGAGRYAIEVSSDTDWDYVVAWDITLAPTAPRDFDGDGDIDHDDCDLFESCATGPSLPPVSGCEKADLDTDGDADQADFGLLQQCISGSGVMPGLECMN